jgi:hypothetical protein
MIMTKESATAFFAQWLGGEHHFPRGQGIQPFGDGWFLSVPGTMATYDDEKLTTLVVLAHERAVRVEIASGGPHRLRVIVHQRAREGRIERHPTLVQAVWNGVKPGVVSGEPLFLIHSKYHQRGDDAVWWGPDRAGYTSRVESAGRYTRKEAIDIVRDGERNEAFSEKEVLALTHLAVDVGELAGLRTGGPS